MAKVITQDMIIKINKLYLEIKTYAGVSRALGGSPSPTTVKKYIIPNFILPKEQYEAVPIPELKLEQFSGVWDKLIQIDEKELAVMEEIRKEVLF